jgi:hypothetical protein
MQNVAPLQMAGRRQGGQGSRCRSENEVSAKLKAAGVFRRSSQLAVGVNEKCLIAQSGDQIEESGI